MSFPGSLQLFHPPGRCRKRRCDDKQKSVLSGLKSHLLDSAYSSRISFLQQQDSLASLSDYLHRTTRIVPQRSTGFRCHSFISAGKAFELPPIKTASLALTKCYHILQRSPLAIKLVSAVVLLGFSLWCIIPLVRQGRSILFNKNDNSWKKSTTYYVMTSYIQPLLLWTGALFLCRALDPVVLPTEASQIIKGRLLNFVRSLSTVLAFAYCLSSVIDQTQKFLMETSDPNDGRNMGFQFAGRAIYSAVWVAAVSLFMELLGFSTQRWLTAGGFGTVLITLAGREILTNFLSSIMIHATRPFVLNEWIQTKIEGYEVSGTVEHVGWWSPTIIRGDDREAVHIPNHKFTVNIVRNLTQKTHWRIKTHLAISHLDVIKINNIVADMRKVLAKNPQVEQQRLHRRVFLDNIDPENQALLILVSCFVKTSHFEEYLGVKEAVLLDLLRVISHHGARLATPIRTIRKVYGDSDLDNIPFGDSIYGRGEAASHRPFLLIEPSYKISSDDKPKPQPRESKTLNPKPKSGETPNPGEEPATKPMEPVSKTNGKDPPGNVSTTKQQPKTETQKLTVDDIESPNLSGSRSSSSALEENIVLGVALEGSKRTLPIDEEMDSPSSASSPQDNKKDGGSVQTAPGSSNGEQ